jgi:hypothetical protein
VRGVLLPLAAREVVCTGPVARWMSRRGWGGVTLPTWVGTWVLYWGPPAPELQRHERTHVAQAQAYGVTRWWLLYWWWLFTRGYQRHPFEVDARRAE